MICSPISEHLKTARLEICRNFPIKSSKSASKGRVLQDEQAKEHTPVCDERFGEARLEICRNIPLKSSKSASKGREICRNIPLKSSKSVSKGRDFAKIPLKECTTVLD